MKILFTMECFKNHYNDNDYHYDNDNDYHNDDNNVQVYINFVNIIYGLP